MDRSLQNGYKVTVTGLHNVEEPATANRATRSADALCIVLLTLGWIGAAILIVPSGEFPLNDDWVYARSVHSLVHDGRWRLLDWSQAFGAPQAWLGSLVGNIFGFSFTSLRLVGLTFGWLGLLSTHALMRQLGAIPKAASLVAAAVGANPLYLSMAATFMTDVPFYAFAIASLAMLVRGFRRDCNGWRLAGLMMAIPAILTRQLGLVLPLGYALAHSLSRPFDIRRAANVTLPLLLGLAVHFAADTWLGNTKQSLSSVGSQGQQFFEAARRLSNGSVAGLKNVILIFQYLGFFVLPSSWPWLRRQWQDGNREQHRALILRLLGWSALPAVVIVGKGLVMPSALNVLTAYGIGPMTLKDTYFLGLNAVHVPMWLRGMWWLVTVLSIIGMAFLIERAWTGLLAAKASGSKKLRLHLNQVVLLLGGTTVTYVFLVAFVAPFYADRYLLLCLPVAHALFIGCHAHQSQATDLIPLADRPSVRNDLLAWVMVGSMLVFSTAAVHDYLEWNRQRWIALRALTEVERIAPSKIDGGYEFNGWHLYRPGGPRFNDRPRSWWWVTDDEYVVGSGPLDGYREIASYPVHRWLTGGSSRIVVLRRSGDKDAKPGR